MWHCGKRSIWIIHNAQVLTSYWRETDDGLYRIRLKIWLSFSVVVCDKPAVVVWPGITIVSE